MSSKYRVTKEYLDSVVFRGPGLDSSYILFTGMSFADQEKVEGLLESAYRAGREDRTAEVRRFLERPGA